MADELKPGQTGGVADTRLVTEAPGGDETYGRHQRDWVPVPREAPIDGKQYARKNEGWVETAAGSTVDYGKGLAVDRTQTPPIVNLTPAGWDPKFLGGVHGTARSATQGLDLSAAGTGEIKVPLATDLLAGSIVEPPPDAAQYVRTRSIANVSSWVKAAGGLYQGRWRPAANVPDIGALAKTAEWTWTADIANAQVPELAPAGLPGIGGRLIKEGDHIVWDGTTFLQISRPTDLTVTEVIPSFAPVKSPALQARVYGSGFTATCRVLRDGVVIPSTFIDSTKLRIDIDPSTEMVPRFLTITVEDGPSYGISAAGSGGFYFIEPTAVAGLQITGLIPDKVMIPSTAPVTVHAYGADFTNTCELLLDGVATPTTFVSATELTYVVDPTGVTVAKTVVVTVRDTTGPVAGSGAEAFEYIVTSTSVDYGNGLRLDETATPPIVHVTPAGPAPQFIGGIWVAPRTATQGLLLDPSAATTGELRAPLATDLEAGSIVEPPPSDTVVYARKRTVAGVSSWAVASGTVWTSDTPPANPVEDTLWWHTTTGELHIYYNDGNTSQWVEIGADAPPSSVYTDDAPPPNPVEDQLWWKSNTGQLFVYYNDGNSTQWVEVTAAAGPPGPAVVTVSDTAPVNPTLNMQWWNSLDSNMYLWHDDGTSKQWVQTNGDSRSSGAITGDVKQGFQPADHNGWIKLDGRATSALTVNQKAAAATLGFATNIPNASNLVLMQKSGTLGTGSGSMSKTLTQANIPAMTSSGVSGGSAETSSGPALDTAVRGTVRGKSATGGTGYYFLDAEGGNVRSIAHTHTVTTPAHTHTVGGSSAPFDVTPAALIVNQFVFLGA